MLFFCCIKNFLVVILLAKGVVMKRYILVVIILVLVFIPKGAEFYTVASTFNGGEYCFYIDGEAKEEDFTRLVKNGDGYVGYCSVIDAPKVKKLYTRKIDGESFTLYGTKVTVGEIIRELSAKIVSEGMIDGIYTVYLYTGRLNTPSVELFNERVNVQIALNGDKLTVGYPIILGSY